MIQVGISNDADRRQKMLDNGYESTGMPPLLLGIVITQQIVGGFSLLFGFDSLGVPLLISFIVPVSSIKCASARA
jgi:hypothetical protein